MSVSPGDEIVREGQIEAESWPEVALTFFGLAFMQVLMLHLFARRVRV